MFPSNPLNLKTCEEKVMTNSGASNQHHPEHHKSEIEEHKSEIEEKEEREENLDKTIEDSFPASDPPSSIPDPEDEDSAA
jgi:hypothetical protein